MTSATGRESVPNLPAAVGPFWTDGDTPRSVFAGAPLAVLAGASAEQSGVVFVERQLRVDPCERRAGCRECVCCCSCRAELQGRSHSSHLQGERDHLPVAERFAGGVALDGVVGAAGGQGSPLCCALFRGASTTAALAPGGASVHSAAAVSWKDSTSTPGATSSWNPLSFEMMMQCPPPAAGTRLSSLPIMQQINMSAAWACVVLVR